MKKLPDDAYAYYLALGASRSHQAVARYFDVDKKTVTNRAIKENWKDRVAEHDRQRRAEAEKRAGESVSAMDDRHLKVAGYIQGKAIETLKSMPLDSAMDAVKAYKLAAEMERLIRGKPNGQSVADLEMKLLAEHERFLVLADPEPSPEPEGEADALAPQPEPETDNSHLIPEPATPTVEPTVDPEAPIVEEQGPEEDDD